MDIACVVCGEAWDHEHIRTEFRPWERELFRAGSGCPACDGASNGFELSQLSDVENADGDPMERIMARADYDAGLAPKWEAPAPVKLWECAACGVEAVRDADTDLPEDEITYHTPIGARCVKWYHSHPFSQHRPDVEPAHTFAPDVAVCEFCLDHCAHCGVAVSNMLAADTYEPGASMSGRDHTEVCCTNDDCMSAREHEWAQEVWENCYNTSERIAYIRAHRSQFEFRSMSDMMSCVRGKYFAGYASELLS